MTRLNERIENFNRAFNIYSEVVNEYNTNKSKTVNQMALVQSFEICFELAWKVLKDYLFQNGIKVFLPKEVIKEAFSNEVITNGQLWIDMLEARNSTSHEYNIEKAKIIFDKIANEYFSEINMLKVKSKNFIS